MPYWSYLSKGAYHRKDSWRSDESSPRGSGQQSPTSSQTSYTEDDLQRAVAHTIAANNAKWQKTVGALKEENHNLRRSKHQLLSDNHRLESRNRQLWGFESQANQVEALQDMLRRAQAWTKDLAATFKKEMNKSYDTLDSLHHHANNLFYWILETERRVRGEGSAHFPLTRDSIFEAAESLLGIGSRGQVVDVKRWWDNRVPIHELDYIVQEGPWDLDVSDKPAPNSHVPIYPSKIETLSPMANVPFGYTLNFDASSTVQPSLQGIQCFKAPRPVRPLEAATVLKWPGMAELVSMQTCQQPAMKLRHRTPLRAKEHQQRPTMATKYMQIKSTVAASRVQEASKNSSAKDEASSRVRNTVTLADRFSAAEPSYARVFNITDILPPSGHNQHVSKQQPEGGSATAPQKVTAQTSTVSDKNRKKYDKKKQKANAMTAEQRNQKNKKRHEQKLRAGKKAA